MLVTVKAEYHLGTVRGRCDEPQVPVKMIMTAEFR